MSYVEFMEALLNAWRAGETCTAVKEKKHAVFFFFFLQFAVKECLKKSDLIRQ